MAATLPRSTHGKISQLPTYSFEQSQPENRPGSSRYVQSLDEAIREHLTTIRWPRPTSSCILSHRVTLRLPSLSGSDGIPYRSVSEWLESIRMKRYILHFRSAGLDTMECVLELTAE